MSCAPGMLQSVVNLHIVRVHDPDKNFSLGPLANSALKFLLLLVVLHRSELLGTPVSISLRFLDRSCRAGAPASIAYFPVTLAFRALFLTSPLLLKISTTKCEGFVRLKLSTSPSRSWWSCENARQPGCRMYFSRAATLHVFPLGPCSVMTLPFWNVSG